MLQLYSALVSSYLELEAVQKGLVDIAGMSFKEKLVRLTLYLLELEECKTI